jgi:hypothetical protein
MRRREGLVQVEVHDVESRIAGAEAAKDGVQVGAVHVGDGARLPHRGHHLVDLVLEDAQRGGVGDHQRGGVRAKVSAQLVQVDPAPFVGADGHGLVADHAGGSGVGAMCAIRHQHLGALLAFSSGPMVCARHEHAGQLALRPGRRLQADGGQAGDLLQQLGQQPLQLQAALCQRVGIERVRVGQARQPRRPLIDLGVVLHGARAEWVEAQVDGVVQVRQPVEMTQQVKLADLGQMRRLDSPLVGRDLRLQRRCSRRVLGRRREANAPATRRRSLEDEGLDDLQLLAAVRRREGGAAT